VIVGRRNEILNKNVVPLNQFKVEYRSLKIMLPSYRNKIKAPVAIPQLVTDGDK
jgi:hypothetical protein